VNQQLAGTTLYGVADEITKPITRARRAGVCEAAMAMHSDGRAALKNAAFVPTLIRLKDVNRRKRRGLLDKPAKCRTDH